MTESSATPPFPEEARKGLLGRYCDLMAPTTEAPVAYHYAVAATYIGLILGRWYVRVGSAKVYPTLYSILVGTTGISHKTTAANAGENVLGAGLARLSGAGSREGMLEALAVNRAPTLFRLPEFVGVLKKAQNKATPLIELFLQLYDHPTVIQNPTRKDPITVTNPVVAILSDSTLEPLIAIFSDEKL